VKDRLQVVLSEFKIMLVSHFCMLYCKTVKATVRACSVFWVEHSTCHTCSVLSKWRGGKGNKPKICDFLFIIIIIIIIIILEMLYIIYY